MFKHSGLFLVLWAGVFALTAWGADQPKNGNSLKAKPPYLYEQVEGLYYFTDQGLLNLGTSGQAAQFDETLHAGQAIDFKNKIAFTFDDVVFGPYLDALLETLAKYQIKAVFFLTATHMGATDQAVVTRYLRRMLAEGHVLGNHTWGHDTLDRGRFAPGKAGAEQATRTEFLRLETTVDQLLGYHYAMEYWRPPFGIRGNQGSSLGERMSIPGRVDQICLAEKRKLILWHINSLDFLMAYPATDPHYLTSHQAALACLGRIRDSRGGVILFHANPRTPALVQEVLRGLTESGQALAQKFSFATIADLLEIKYGTATP